MNLGAPKPLSRNPKALPQPLFVSPRKRSELSSGLSPGITKPSRVYLSLKQPIYRICSKSSKKTLKNHTGILCTETWLEFQTPASAGTHERHHPPTGNLAASCKASCSTAPHSLGAPNSAGNEPKGSGKSSWEGSNTLKSLGIKSRF